MATISEAEILKAAAEASLMSTSTLDNLGVTQVLSSTSASAANIGQLAEGPVTMPTSDPAVASTSQGLDDTEFGSVPTVSENAVVRSGFEVGGKTYDNVEALLAAHLVGLDDASTPVKTDSSSNTDFAYRDVG